MTDLGAAELNPAVIRMTQIKLDVNILKLVKTKCYCQLRP